MGRRFPLALEDPLGDGVEGGLDFNKLWLADAGERLYIRFSSVDVIDPSGNNSLRFPVFGSTTTNRLMTWVSIRMGVYQNIDANENTSFQYTVIGFRCMPTLDSNEFELAIQLDAKPDGTIPMDQSEPTRFCRVLVTN